VLPRLKASNILAFMNQNVVIVTTADFDGLRYASLAKKTVRLHLVPRAGKQAIYQDGTRGGGVYHLRPGRAVDRGGGSSHSFLAFWVAYRPDGGTGTWLGADVDLMFTATMSGCSSGVGSRTDNGVMAAHANSAKVTGQHAARLQSENPGMSLSEIAPRALLAQIRHQHQRLTALGTADRVAHPNVYLSDGAGGIRLGNSTPFGVREAGAGGRWGWSVYWQRYDDLGGTGVHHRGVSKHIDGLS
jgi:hypothetical protein